MILILTKDSYYIAHYDDEVDKVTNYQRVALEDIELIELGPLDQSAFNLPFKSSSNRGQFCLRIHYRLPQPPTAVFFNGETTVPVPANPASLNAGSQLSGYFHMFRASNLRLFNNMAVNVTSEEERQECLKSVADSIIVAMELANWPPAPFVQAKLEKRKSRIPEMNDNLGATSGGAPSSSKAVTSGLKALTSVTSHFSRLNPINKFRQKTSDPQVQLPQINVDGQTATV